MVDLEVVSTIRSPGRKLPPLAVSQEDCREYRQASQREWLETNGTGAFAMGTVAGANTRRYHGLLVASLEPPVERYVMLAKLEEIADAGTRPAELSVNQYPGTLHPRGHEKLALFRLDPFPTWTFVIDDAVLEKRVFLLRGEQTVVIRYRASRPMRLAVSPLLAFRDYHSLGRANQDLDGRATVEASATDRGAISLRPYPGLPRIRIAHSRGRFVPDAAWHYNVEYAEEQARGLDFREDLFRPGHFELDLTAGEEGYLVATFDETATFDQRKVADAERRERDRRRSELEDPFASRLAAAADQFLVERRDGSPTAIAGYPWFTDWGRDTMIALPGLLVTRGRLADARAVLCGFLQHLDRGLIPNRFPDRSGPPEYNTVDATLWLFQAAQRYLLASGDRDFLRSTLWPCALEIMAWHARGTHHGIKVDPSDGLLVAGDEGSQLTWMDARVEGRVVTARHGKPVEINALYYNALRLMVRWGEELGEHDEAARFSKLADAVGRAFATTFWNEARGCLFDVVRPDGSDGAIRPNQLFAVSLPYSPLQAHQCRAVVDVVERTLLTGFGLRTLAPGEPGYVPHYRGGPGERDSAYHQGTVWPWLLGPFIRAFLRVHGRSQGTVLYCQSLLTGIEDHLRDGCLGTIAEVFDAEAPFKPGGAPAQAWSVAELLSVWVDELRLPGPGAAGS